MAANNRDFMPWIPLPDLDADKRITRADHKNAGHISPSRLVKTYILFRIPSVIGVKVMNFYEHIARRGAHLCDGQRIAVVIEDYAYRLQAETDYQRIKDLFLRNIDIHGMMDGHTERRFKNLLMLCFKPASVDTTPPHDDWIMMAMAITAEVAIEILISSGNALDAETLVSWMEDVLRPRRNMCFYVSNWLFLRWLQNYKTLIDPTRMCNLLHDPKVLSLSQKQIDTSINAQLPDIPFVGPRLTNRRTKDLRTVLCPSEAPENTYGSKCGTGSNKRAFESKPHIVQELLLSYVASRIPSTDNNPNGKGKFLSGFTYGEYTDFSQKPLGKAMSNYGEKIFQSSAYKEVYKAMKEKDCTNIMKFRMLVAKYILPQDKPISYDHIMTAFLLMSDIINGFIAYKVEPHACLFFNRTSISIMQNAEMSSTIQKMLFRIAHNYPQMKDKTTFDLLDDASLIDGQSPVGGSSAAPTRVSILLDRGGTSAVASTSGSRLTLQKLQALNNAGTAGTAVSATRKTPATDQSIFMPAKRLRTATGPETSPEKRRREKQYLAYVRSLNEDNFAAHQLEEFYLGSDCEYPSD